MPLRRAIVDDYELIAHAELAPGPRLTAITGETGSGKTMLLDAIAFGLGARPKPDAVRRGSRRARVALEIEPTARLREVLEAQGLSVEDDEIVIVRELEGGKTSARFCGVPVSATQLRAIASETLEIVGQHEAQRLLAAPAQLQALDAFAGAEVLALRARVEAAYNRLRELENELAAVRSREGQALAEVDFAIFAVREIGDAAPVLGEDDALRERRDVLANAERIAQVLREAHGALSEREGSADEGLAAAAASLAGIARYGSAFEELATATRALQSELAEVAARIARDAEGLERDPAELEAVAARLELLDHLKKKYGGTIEAVLEARARFERIVQDGGESERRTGELAAEVAATRADLEAAAVALSAARHEAAHMCQGRIAEELSALAMPAARFEVAFEPLDAIGPSGAERCEFRLAPNPGEPARPLARSASGGELSRVMLALTVVLADRASHATLLFDEIDAGVGGVTANAVGARLVDLARDMQVVCVTHLAQIAAFADRQFALRKHARGGESKSKTTIELEPLDDRARLAELARMLSGKQSGVSLEHARALLRERQKSVSARA
ncbi:MAG: DNA repair protein RecN [Candidatus Eremiobacteraeota bacterium]|nr:DNA repair protein RecN [Candidatus Eremiobacteraeota bacterium]